MESKKGRFNYKWKSIHAKKKAEIADPVLYEKAVSELKNRLIAVQRAHVLATLDTRGLDQNSEGVAKIEMLEIRPAVAARLAVELLRSLGEVLEPLRGLDAGIAVPEVEVTWEAPPRPTKWRSGVLESKHIDRYGERCCVGCGAPVRVMDRVSWAQGSADVWHEKCRPKAETKKRRISVYTLTQWHIDRHGISTCEECGLACSVGSRVAWRFGGKGIRHEACETLLGEAAE